MKIQSFIMEENGNSKTIMRKFIVEKLVSESSKKGTFNEGTKTIGVFL